MKKLLLAGVAALSVLSVSAAHATWECKGGEIQIAIEKLATDLEQVTITATTRRYNTPENLKAGIGPTEIGPRGSIIHRPGDTLRWGKSGPWFNGKPCRLAPVEKEEGK